MNEKKGNSNSGFWIAIVIALGIGWAIGKSMQSSSLNLRSLTESDTIYTEDSIYNVDFKIKSVVPNNEKYHEPEERN